MTGITHLSAEPMQTCAGDGLGLNETEIDGLRAILEHLMSLPENKRGIPKEIARSDLLVDSLKVTF